MKTVDLLPLALGLVLATAHPTGGLAQNAAPPAAAPAINLLASNQGGQLLAAGNPNWALMIDGKLDTSTPATWNSEGIFAFKDEKPATFDTFSIYIPSANNTNIKEFELLVGDSIDGEFRSVGKFRTKNMLMVKTNGWQDYKFEPVTAKYLKFKVISLVDAIGNWIPITVYEIRLMGSLKN